jgi:hypothetical protein
MVAVLMLQCDPLWLPVGVGVWMRSLLCVRCEMGVASFILWRYWERFALTDQLRR